MVDLRKKRFLYAIYSHLKKGTCTTTCVVLYLGGDICRAGEGAPIQG